MSLLNVGYRLCGGFFPQVAGELVKGKPTYVAIGDLHALPYADEIGLSA